MRVQADVILLDEVIGQSLWTSGLVLCIRGKARKTSHQANGQAVDCVFSCGKTTVRNQMCNACIVGRVAATSIVHRVFACACAFWGSHEEIHCFWRHCCFSFLCSRLCHVSVTSKRGFVTVRNIASFAPRGVAEVRYLHHVRQSPLPRKSTIDQKGNSQPLSHNQNPGR